MQSCAATSSQHGRLRTFVVCDLPNSEDLSGTIIWIRLISAWPYFSGMLVHQTLNGWRPGLILLTICLPSSMRCAYMGQKLEALLREKVGPLPLVGHIRGRGLFWAVEFVLDKKAKTPFPL